MCSKKVPEIGANHSELLKRHDVHSLLNRAVMHSQILLCKIINDLVNCPALLEVLLFHLPNLTTRNNVLPPNEESLILSTL